MWSQQRARTLMFETQSRILPLTEKSSASKAPPATKPALAEASVRTCDANCQFDVLQSFLCGGELSTSSAASASQLVSLDKLSSLS